MRPQVEHILLRQAAMLLFAILFLFRPAVVAAQTAAGTITGTVKAADTQALLPNLAVGVYRADDANTRIKAVRTNTAGVFTLTGLTVGTYKVRFFTTGINYIGGWYNKQNVSPPPPASAVEAFGDGDVITLTSSAGTNLGETQLSLGRTITGKVTQAAAPATGITGVYAQAYLEDGITWVRRSDTATATDGSYTISGLREGNYKVFFNAYDTEYTTAWYSSATSTNTVLSSAQATSVTAGTSNVNGQLATGGSISGTVYKTGNVPVVGALISVYDSSYVFKGYKLSGTGGTYTVTGLPVPGNYFVQFYERAVNNIGTGLTEWYQDASSPSDTTKIKSVDITTASSGIDAVLDRGPISGKVTDSAGLPLSGVSVTVYDSSKQTVASVATNAQGLYNTGELQAGDYKVQFSPLSWYANKANFTEATSVPAGSSGVNGIFKPFNFAHIYNVLLLKKRCFDTNGTPMHCNCFEADGTPAYCSEK